jgi:hypothetical protein
VGVGGCPGCSDGDARLDRELVQHRAKALNLGRMQPGPV